MNDCTRQWFPVKALSFVLLCAFGPAVYALPTGGVVSAGAAGINISAASTTITQTTQNAAINWQSFSIGASEAVRFVQPSAQSVVLNRVLGADPSSIFGTLSANGKVFLVNPNGILFGSGASVNVGGLVASTLNITDSDFMAGTYKFSGSSKAAVTNAGDIRSNGDGGYVALLGNSVANDGVIAARLGTVALAGGRTITLDVAGDGLLNVVVNEGAVNALVRNGGLIQADGGQVLLTTQAAGNLLNSSVINTGLIEAQTIENHNGTIRLLGDMQSGTVTVDGMLAARGGDGGGDGGFIETSASRVTVVDGARIDTLAPQGKTGTWLIDPRDFTIANAGGDMAPLTLVTNLVASNVTISSDNGRAGTLGDIHVNDSIHWAGASILTLNAVHDVLVGAAITADTAGAKLIMNAGHDVAVTAPLTTIAAGSAITINATNDVRIGGPLAVNAAGSTIGISAGRNLTTTSSIDAVAAASSISLHGGYDVNIGGAITGTAANTSLGISAGHDLVTSFAGALHMVAADSSIALTAANDITIGGAILGTAAGTVMNMNAGRDATVGAAVTAVAAASSISITAGRDVTTTANGALAGGAATTAINLNAGHNVNVNAAIAAAAAGSSIRLIAGLDGSGPGIAGGTVNIATGAAVTSTDLSIRFNPNGYANTSAEIGRYPALADAKAWVFLQGANKVYDGTTAASLAFKGTPSDGGLVALVPGTAAFASKSAGTGKSIAFNGYSIGGADAGKFALFSAAGTTSANITQRPLILTALGANKVYDGNTTDAASILDNRIPGDVLSVAYTAASFADKNVGNRKAVGFTGLNVTGSDVVNYSFNTASVTTTANITPAPLTITAVNDAKVYGQTPPLPNFSSVGLVAGETVGFVSLTSPGTAAAASVAGGPYVITPSGAAGGTFMPSNYLIRYVNGLLTVLPASLLITAADVTKIVGETVVLRAFDMEGLQNDETIGAIPEVSPGAAAAATVAGSPYAITPGPPVAGGTYTPSNYAIVYVNGVLTVIPVAVAPLTLPAELAF